MAIDPPYRLDLFRNIINVHWIDRGIIVGFTLLSSSSSVIATGGSAPPGPDKAVSPNYMESWSTSLSYDGSSGYLLGRGVITTDLTWSYSGGGSETSNVDPYTFLGVFSGVPEVEGFGIKSAMSPPNPPPYMGFANPDGTHPYADTLSVTATAYGYVGTGPFTHTVFGSCMQATNVTQFEAGTTANIFILGDVIGDPRTFNFSTITATYKGSPWVPAAIAAATGGFIRVLLIPEGTA